MSKNVDKERLHPARKVWERYGVTSRTISRWLDQSETDFPKPVYLNGRRYWFEADLLRWEDGRASCSSNSGAGQT